MACRFESGYGYQFKMIKIILMPFRAALAAAIVIAFSPVLLIALIVDHSIISSELWKDVFNFVIHGSNETYWD